MPERRICAEPSFRLKLREDFLLPSFCESRVTVTLLRARHTPTIDRAGAAVLVGSPSDLALQTAQLSRNVQKQKLAGKMRAPAIGFSPKLRGNTVATDILYLFTVDVKLPGVASGERRVEAPRRKKTYDAR